MSHDKEQSDHLEHGSSPRWIQEGAKPSQVVKPPTVGPAGGAGDSGASSE